MKRSRIICSSIVILSILLSIFLTVVLAKSSIDNKSSINFNIKLMHVALVALCTGLYFFVKKKLLNKVNSKKIISLYCYMFLAVMVFVSRLVTMYLIKGGPIEFHAGYINGIGSYLNYGLGKLLNNYSYANIIINTLIVYASCTLIKKILLNITNNDFVSTITSIIYIFIPKSLISVKEYVRYGYNILFILIGIYILIKIIDLVKDFNNKNIRYVYYSVLLGIVASIDVLLGGSYIFWLLLLTFTTVSATYVDITHFKFSKKFKTKLEYKKRVLAEKIEKINVSKLVYVTIIALSISIVFVIINSIIRNVDNFEMRNIFDGIYLNLNGARNYYLVIIIFTIVFDILGIILKRDIDVKMIVIKTCYMSSLILIPFINSVTYSSYVFDTFLSFNAIISICNVCINREEKVKLLKEKN